MTAAEILSNAFAALGLLVAGGSAAIAWLALRRTREAEEREREAVIVIRNVWSGTPGIDDTLTSGDRGLERVRHNDCITMDRKARVRSALVETICSWRQGGSLHRSLHRIGQKRPAISIGLRSAMGEIASTIRDFRDL